MSCVGPWLHPGSAAVWYSFVIQLSLNPHLDKQNNIYMYHLFIQPFKSGNHPKRVKSASPDVVSNQDLHCLQIVWLLFSRNI